ncbi:MAG: DUF2085 domain-containing protein [Chloroflexota bacterium]|nr:DUF2085 domain-containing protein [Chloroflexota bacterium]
MRNNSLMPDRTPSHQTGAPALAGGRVSALPWLAPLLLSVTLATFLIATPPGLLTKADMVGYAVCHQIESHSFTLAGRQLPLCARCTGTFLGALLGLFGQAVVLRRRRAADFPPPPLLVVLISFTLIWIADGANSYLALVGGPHLYHPANALRLTTGVLNGTTMSALVYPLLNVSLWRSPVPRSALRTGRDLALLLSMQASLVLLVLSGWDPLLYPVALLSAAGVLALLTAVNTVIAVVLLRRENSVDRWRQAVPLLTVGLALSLIQVGAIDLLRYALTGTLHGISTFR